MIEIRAMRAPIYSWVSALPVAAAVLLLVLAVGPGLASAHAEVTSSTPANGSTLQTPPGQITLNFSEEISVDQSTASLVDSRGTAVSGVSSAVDKANRQLMTIQVPSLQPGQYTVKWIAVTEDDNGHTNGTLNFTVADTAQPAATSTPGAASSGTSGGATPVEAASGSGSAQPMPTTGAGDSPWLFVVVAGIALTLSAFGAALKVKARA